MKLVFDILGAAVILAFILFTLASLFPSRLTKAAKSRAWRLRVS